MHPAGLEAGSPGLRREGDREGNRAGRADGTQGCFEHFSHGKRRTKWTQPANYRPRSLRQRICAGIRAHMPRNSAPERALGGILHDMPPRMSKAKDAKTLLSELEPPIRSLVQKLRTFVKKHAPDLEEQVKWGGLCSVGNRVVCYIHPHEAHVDFGFFQGVSLDDPKAILEGKGKFVRHIKIRKASDIQEREFARLLKQAMRIDG